MEMDRGEAAAALASARETRQRFERTLACGPGYSLVFGGLIGWLVAIQGLPLAWRGLGYIPFFIAIILMVRYQRRTTGRFVNGYRRGRTRWVAVGMAILLTVFVLLSVWLGDDGRNILASVGLGVLAVGPGYFANRLWMRAYRADVEEGRP